MIDFETLHNQMAACRWSLCDAFSRDPEGSGPIDVCYVCRRRHASADDRILCPLHAGWPCAFYQLYSGHEAIDPTAVQPGGVATDEESEL